MTVGSLILVVLLLLLIGSIPAWPYSREWGYAPSGLIGLLLLIVIGLVFLGLVPFLQTPTGIVNPMGTPVPTEPTVVPTPVVPTTPR